MDEIDILMNAPEEGLEPYLERACGADSKLRARVDALLAAQTAAGSFMDQAVVRDDLLEAGGAAEGPGLVIGNYKLLERCA